MALMLLVGTSSVWAQTWCLAGSFNGWSDATLSNGKLTVTISSIGEYQFKIKQKGTWDGAYSNDGAQMKRDDCSNWLLYTNKGDSKFYADVVGDYTFTFNSASKTLSITYPPQCATCCNNNYVVGNTELTGYDWNPGQNQMTCSNNLYSKTFTNVVAGTHQFKITNGSWGWSTDNITTKSGSNYLSLSKDGGNIKFTTTSIYNITIYFDGNGCYATYESACTPPAAPTLNPNSTTVCSGTSFKLPGNHRWYTDATGGTKLTSNTISSGVTKQTFYYAEAGEDGCVSTTRTKYTVNVDAKPAITLASPSSICTGTEIDLTKDYVTSKTGTVTWYSDANRSQEITNGIVTPINTGTSQTTNTYYAKVTNGVCSAKTDVSLSIKVDPQSAITLKEAPTICQGTTITFANYVNTSTGTVTWHTKSDFSDAAITSAKPSQTTTYYVKASSGDCTPATASLKVTVNNKPAVPTLSADKTSLVSPDKATLTAGNTTNDLTYTLYNGETPGESQTSTGGNLYFKVGEAGNYTVRVSNSCGTSTSDVVTITVCTPETNEFRHANSSYNQLANQPTYYPGDKAYFVSTGNCCLTGTWSANVQKGEEGWWTDLKGGTPRFYMTLTRAGNFTITNMATNGCTQDKNVKVNLDFTITALSQVTNANGTASGANIALTWKHSANHSKVMVVRYPSSGTETIPAGGEEYSAGNTLGEGTVVCIGTEESYTDQNLPAGASYKYYFYTVNNNYYSEGVVLNMSSCPVPAKPVLTSTAVTACDGVVTADGYITIGNMSAYTDDDYTFNLGNETAYPDANGKITISSANYTEYTVTVTNSCGNSNSADVDIAINDNAPVITGNTSFQPNGSTTLTSDKGESTTWVALDGGDITSPITSPKTGTSIVFTAKENGIYHVQATYNGCSTTVEIKVQDDLYVWMRKPNKKENAYNNFYYPNENPTQGGMMYYKEFTSKPTTVPECNQGGREADKECTDKEGYTWYGYVISKAAIEANTYYFTVHAANPNGKNGIYTHTLPYKLENVTSDLYFVMDESGSNDGWNINAPVVVRASGDAKFNSNNFADFVPLYVKDANICGKEVVSFEWQKSDSQNGTYTTYNGKSGEGINNIRTREAGWYRCVVTYAEGKGTATSNAIQVTNTTSGTPGTLADFSSKLPVIMVNTNGVGFPKEPASGFPSVDAENLKAKVSVDVIIKKGENIVYDRKARMNYRGSSSLNFKKKSYAFVSGQDSCVFDKSRHDYVKTKKEKMLNLLGDANYTTSDKDWVLYAATPDPSMMRNRLVFDLYQQMRPGEWGVHSTYVELIVDGEYQGVYVFMDKITANEGRVNITNSDGFIVKFDKTDVADRVEKDGDQKTFATTRTGTKNSSDGITSYDTKIDQRFEIEYPEKEDIQIWDAFYGNVQQRFEDFETALANKQYDKVRAIIDYDSWADWFILSEFIKNQDGFRASNIFIYNGGKIMATPLWDQELSMDNRTRMAHGSTDPEGLLSTTSSVYDDAFPAPFWFTGRDESITGCLLNDPCFVALVKTKWAEYQAGVLSASNCSTLVAKYHGELDDNIRSREVTKWPYTQDVRGTTNSGKYMGYYNNKEGDPNHYSYNASKNAITDYASKRSTKLDSNSGLGKAINGLEGEALIFTITPSLAETTPWQQVQLTVNAPAGYEYTLNVDDELKKDNVIIKENGDSYGIKIPRPAEWGVGGNGEPAQSKQYNVTATIEVSGENACGTIQDGTATSTITLKDVTEKCEPEIIKP
ncbi:MAG: CotH kinase family protein [Paludibacteraceae bacterium]|nr:CotH kinase family protein [Paludibacteraceae bacterium]